MALVVSSSAKAGALARVEPYGIPTLVVNREELANPQFVRMLQTDYHVTFIVLAGFLSLIPETLTAAYTHRMINIHPALLPRYGGKGMYGRHVHEAVKAAGAR